MAKTLWETLKPLEAEHARLKAQLLAVEAKMEAALRAWSGGGPAPKTTRAPAKGTPKTNGKGPSLTQRVLGLVTGNRTAASIVASLGLRASDRRRVYDVLKKAAAAGKIRRVGDGTFAPKK